MKIPLVDLARQHAPIRAEIDRAIASVIDRSAFILGSEVAAFEKAFAAYHGRKHCVGVASGTHALEAALLAIGVGPGDEVIAPSYTFLATVGAIEAAGAKPVLVEVEESTATIDPAAVEAAITPRTKAVIPVHLYGQAADMDRLAEIARKKGIAILEDCAQAHGALWKGKKIGTFGSVAAFSFFPSKNLGALGDGGAVLTDDDEVASRLAAIRVHGRYDKYETVIRGDNLRIDTIQAAALGVKLPHLDEWNAQRRAAAKRFDSLLAGADGIRPIAEGPNRTHVYHLYVIRCAGRDERMKKLNDAGIGAGVHYPLCVHEQRGFVHLGVKKGQLPVSERLAQECLSLPVFPGIRDDEVEEIARVLRKG